MVSWSHDFKVCVLWRQKALLLQTRTADLVATLMDAMVIGGTVSVFKDF